MRANRKVFWISVVVAILSIVAIAIFSNYENKTCKILSNVFISLVGGAFLAAASAYVTFNIKRKEYIIKFDTDYIGVFNILVDIQNWYSHYSTDTNSKPNEKSIRFVVSKFEEISNFNYSAMNMILDDFCSLFFLTSKIGIKLNEMMQMVNKLNYAYTPADALKFSQFHTGIYDEQKIYDFYIVKKSNDINNLFLKLPELQSELHNISKINKYLETIYKKYREKQST